MGDSVFPTRNADAQPSHRRESSLLLHHSHSNGSGPINGEEEPYTIKCICGFADDTYDGNTVFCDRCNTWQHIACYYYPETTLEDDFEHNCVDCKPSQRSRLDSAAAKSRQRVLRHPQDASDDRKTRRPGSKSNKKTKNREANGNAPQTNGWPKNDIHADDSRDESPRDQGPPTKRSKTSHKYASSTNNSTSRSSEGRNRSGSHASLVPQEQIRLPLRECPPDFLSSDFIRVHHENTQFHHAQANLHLNIEITDLLSNWLDDQDSFYQATHGKNHNEVFQHFPQPIEELEQPIQKHVRVDSDVRFHGEHPVWPFLTVANDLVTGDYVGELRGSIGRTDEYMQDESNQWAKLRHPDHFVFFHPCLPIYIDSRSEGTELRYARRSCRPNLKMETIITGTREYRFCFTAIDDIPRDTEITIPWDTRCDPQLYRILDKVKTATSESDLQSVSQWVGNLLAHFGGCACEQQTGSGLCLLAHFDRRLSHLRIDSNNARIAKVRKRPPVSRLSPSHAIKLNNSRASSGGPSHTDADDDIDMEDCRSVSRSTDNKSSRGTTPLQQSKEDFAGETGAMSEREKRKVLQSVKLFERLDHNQSSKANQPPGPKRKKRSSGSNVNTPTTAHQSNGRLSHDSAPGTPNTALRGNLGHGHSGRTSASAFATNPLLRPIYSDALIQTEVVDTSGPELERLSYRARLPRSIQLRERSLLQKCRTPQPTSLAYSEETRPLGRVRDNRSPVSPRSSPRIPITEAGVSKDPANNIEEQLDRTTSVPPNPSLPDTSADRNQETIGPSQSPLTLAHPPIKPPPPPPSTAKMSPKGEPHLPRQDSNELIAAPLALDLSSIRTPRPTIMTESPVETPKAISTVTTADDAPETPQTADGSRIVPPLPNVILTAKASPAKKKMSLSDYMSKRKTEIPSLERTQSQGQSGLLAGHQTSSTERDGSGPAMT